MNFDFTEEQKLFADSVRKFAEKHLEKDALKRAHESGFPFDVAKLMSQQGLMGITIPEADGGQGGSLMDAVIAIEQIALVCPRSSDVLHEGNFGPIRTLAQYGTDDQKRRYLRPLREARDAVLQSRATGVPLDEVSAMRSARPTRRRVLAGAAAVAAAILPRPSTTTRSQISASCSASELAHSTQAPASAAARIAR